MHKPAANFNPLSVLPLLVTGRMLAAKRVAERLPPPVDACNREKELPAHHVGSAFWLIPTTLMETQQQLTITNYPLLAR